MTFAGWAAFSSSNSNSSTRVAFLENTLKLTPPSQTVAPSGALVALLDNAGVHLWPLVWGESGRRACVS